MFDARVVHCAARSQRLLTVRRHAERGDAVILGASNAMPRRRSTSDVCVDV